MGFGGIKAFPNSMQDNQLWHRGSTDLCVLDRGESE